MENKFGCTGIDILSGIHSRGALAYGRRIFVDRQKITILQTRRIMRNDTTTKPFDIGLGALNFVQCPGRLPPFRALLLLHLGLAPDPSKVFHDHGGASPAGTSAAFPAGVKTSRFPLTACVGTTVSPISVSRHDSTD